MSHMINIPYDNSNCAAFDNSVHTIKFAICSSLWKYKNGSCATNNLGARKYKLKIAKKEHLYFQNLE